MVINNIIHDSIVDGYGLRTTVFFQGCNHMCKGCQNKSTWDRQGGYEISVNDLFEKIKENNFTKKVTLSGGEPLLQKELAELLKLLKENEYDIWLYTGFKKEVVKKEILDNIDVLVDGKFIEELKDTTLKFRGSSNQNIYFLNKK